MQITRNQLRKLIYEEIKRVKPGCYKVYPKKPKKGKKRREALSKKCKSLPAAKRQLAAIEISKKMTERDIDEGKKRKRKYKRKDPKVGTGKKPKGSGRRLYTDENPKDTVPVKFRTASDIRKTLSSKSFKSKSHKRQSQIINLIHQRVRVAKTRAKDPKTKKRLTTAYKYAMKRKEASKRKTKRMRKK